MRVAKPGKNRILSAGRPRPVLILASGERIRHMTIRPWMTAAAAGLAALLTFGYCGSTAYLLWRDDLIGAANQRQERLQQQYEDRIAALRAQIDRITSRQMIEQRTVQVQLDQLLEQQNALFSRRDRIERLVQRAEASGLTVPSEGAGIPAALPSASAAAYAPSLDGGAAAHAGSASQGLKAIDRLLKPALRLGDHAPAAAVTAPEAPKEGTDLTLSRVSHSLQALEQEQKARVTGLTDEAERTASAISAILRRTGVSVGSDRSEGKAPKKGLGGPFVPPATGYGFDASLEALDVALTRLETVRQAASTLPYGNPAPGHEITSGFGNRIDPFLGRLALHAGVDFQAETGQRVRSTGAGRVVAAGDSGGYGNMVDIDHGHGLLTRYGHLSRILVREGDTVAAGDVIGLAGSTGRSTAPHVHYEVRQDGEAIDPTAFLNAGLKLKRYLQ
ncbi:M23 family metallopeptidase [Rhizobium sp. CSW-27]|nr:M23 family metallopeptidase [Rhizobium sp. CSW-27]